MQVVYLVDIFLQYRSYYGEQDFCNLNLIISRLCWKPWPPPWWLWKFFKRIIFIVKLKSQIDHLSSNSRVQFYQGFPTAQRKWTSSEQWGKGKPLKWCTESDIYVTSKPGFTMHKMYRVEIELYLSSRIMQVLKIITTERWCKHFELSVKTPVIAFSLERETCGFVYCWRADIYATHNLSFEISATWCGKKNLQSPQQTENFRPVRESFLLWSDRFLFENYMNNHFPSDQIILLPI